MNFRRNSSAPAIVVGTLLVGLVTLSSTACAAGTKKEIGPWTLFCDDSDNKLKCVLAQVVEASSGPAVKLSIGFSWDNGAEVTSALRIEPPPTHSEGVSLLIDGYDAALVNLPDCDSAGCSSTFNVASRIFIRMLTGQILTVQFRNSSGSGVSLDASLQQLPQGMGELTRSDMDNTSNEPVAKFFNPKKTDEFVAYLVATDHWKHWTSKSKIAMKQGWVSPLDDLTLADPVTGAINCKGQSYSAEKVTVDVSDVFEIIKKDNDFDKKLKDMSKIISDCDGKYQVELRKSGPSTSDVSTVEQAFAYWSAGETPTVGQLRRFEYEIWKQVTAKAYLVETSG